MMHIVDSGAFTMALNVLRRAGKTEVADELEKASRTLHPRDLAEAMDHVLQNKTEDVMDGGYYESPNTSLGDDALEQMTTVIDGNLCLVPFAGRVLNSIKP